MIAAGIVAQGDRELWPELLPTSGASNVTFKFLYEARSRSARTASNESFALHNPKTGETYGAPACLPRFQR